MQPCFWGVDELVFDVHRNPSPALGVELNTLLLPGAQKADRYPTLVIKTLPIPKFRPPACSYAATRICISPSYVSSFFISQDFHFTSVLVLIHSICCSFVSFSVVVVVVVHLDESNVVSASLSMFCYTKIPSICIFYYCVVEPITKYLLSMCVLITEDKSEVCVSVVSRCGLSGFRS